MRWPHIITVVLAVFAAAVLFATYGTVLPSTPFAPIQLNVPTTVDSDGEFTAIVDSGSSRALILNAEGDLTGVVNCDTLDAPFDAITDACVSGGTVYLSGVRFAPDSDVIEQERVAAYDKGGNFLSVVYEVNGISNMSPGIKSLSNATDGVAVAYERDTRFDFMMESAQDDKSADSSEPKRHSITFEVVSESGPNEIRSIDAGDAMVHDAAFSSGSHDRFAALNIFGDLGFSENDYAYRAYAGHVFTSIDIDDEGNLFACDDVTGALCIIPPGSTDVLELIAGEGYDSVHENKGVLSLCQDDANGVLLCDVSGIVRSEFSEVRPSMGFSARMLIVWASGLYLAILALVLVVRKTRRLIREGKTAGIGPMFMAVAVVAAIAIAIGSLSYSSYQERLATRADEINMCADYLSFSAGDLSEPLEKINDRDALHTGDEGQMLEALKALFGAEAPVLSLVSSAHENGIGMYFVLYAKDDRGVFYLDGSSSEYVMGTSMKLLEREGLKAAFENSLDEPKQLFQGQTLRDATQYRLVQIPASQGGKVVGVIEVGSKTRSLVSSIAGTLVQRILALLVLILVVYLAYSELRSCGECLFSYRQRQQKGELGSGSLALLTRPFTLAITMLTGIDSVMTVLIARDLLTKAGMADATLLLGLPAVMLGIGLIIGQGLYGIFGSKVGLRKLMACGAFAMFACACLTGAAVASGVFWLYCAAKLLMSVPFGLLYVLGYSLPRLAEDDEARIEAAGGVKRTDTSAAALGTVLGGYAAHGLGNVWVYGLVAIACLPVIIMALNLLPRGIGPLEGLAQPDRRNGRIRDFLKMPTTLGLALLVVLPVTIAAGYASFLFPLFSQDLGLEKSDINNIVALGQLIVFVCIGRIELIEGRFGKWKPTTMAVALLGTVFLLFSINTTLVWSVAVIPLVALLCKTSDGWKVMWMKAANDADVPAGQAASAMFVSRSLALVAQPFVLRALLGATDSIAVIVIGVICLACAGLFFLVTREKLS